MTSRPVIFISSVSHELHSARDLVAKTLIGLGYDPKWQDIAPTESGDVRGMLRKWVDDSAAVIQLVGHCHGFRPNEPDPEFGPVSYTQYEALYARQQGKPVYYIVLDATHPQDGCGCEPVTLHELQEKYRDKVKGYGDRYDPSASLDQTKIIVLGLRDDLAKLRAEWNEHRQRIEQDLASTVANTTQIRRRVTSWAVLMLVLFVIAGAGLWFMMHRESSDIVVVKDQNDKLLAALRELPRTLGKQAPAQNPQDHAARLTTAYAELDANHQLPPGTLARELPRLASRLLARADTSAFDRANALFAANQFAEAEAAALEAADAARKAMIDALLLAGLAADALARYPDELHDYRDAEKLTDQNGDPREWARVQRAIAGALVSMGKFDEALAAATAARDTCEQKIGPDDPETLESRHVFAGILFTQEKNRAAEDEYRAVTAARTRVLGAEHPETLRSRNAMALAQTFQGRHAEAEEEFRTVLAARERVLGAEDPDTLRSRNNLAQSLSFQSKFPEAEQQHRMVLADRERVLGPENPDVFESCFNLAHTLMGQHKLQDALPFALCAEKGYKARRGEDYRYTKEAAARREEIEAALAKEKAKSMEEKEGGK